MQRREIAEVKDANGALPIVRAARAQQHKAVAMIMDKGLWRLEDRSAGGLTLLMIAAQVGSLKWAV